MEKPLSYLDWELQLRNGNRSETYQILAQGETPQKTEFNNLLKCFSKRESLIKSGGILSSQFKFKDMDIDRGIIACVIQNRSLGEFKLEINKNKKFIYHQCQEFRSLNKFKKYFCSHIIRLFFILKEFDIEHTTELLKHISSQDYNFFPKIKQNQRN